MQAIPFIGNLMPFREEPGAVPYTISLRNACFDPIFYDTTNLSLEEKNRLLLQAAGCDEGGMLLVHPAADGKEIEYFSLSHDLIVAHPEIDSVAIPGVGSSLIGAAALARQVANITGRPVVGIIAGYGAADVISEALGGFFVFGTRNMISSMIADWRRRLTPSREIRVREMSEPLKLKSTTFLVDEPESNTLLNIMLRQAGKLRLIVGHSKGSLNIQNVLHAFVKETRDAVQDYEDIAVVTFGCGVALPPAFKNVYQYLGTWDVLGGLNTPDSETHDPTLRRIKHKGHNLCPWNPWHMPVEEVLPEIIG